MAIIDKLNNITNVKEQLRTLGEISEEEPFKNYPTILGEKISNGSEDDVLKIRTIDGKTDLNHLFFKYTDKFNGYINGDAAILVQKVNDEIMSYLKKKDFGNISSMVSTFSNWNFGSAQYVNYDIDISNFKFASNGKIIFDSCFSSRIF